MILRTSVVFCHGLRTCFGSGISQVSRSTLLTPNFSYIRGNLAHRSSRSFNKPHSFASQLRIPLLFTVTTGTACVFGYQHFGNLISPRLRHPGSVLEWWHLQPDWFKCYWLICGSCILVFSAYRLAILSADKHPLFLTFMSRYFVTKAKPLNAVEACAQLVLYAFCHISPLHLGINMYIFHNISKNLVPDIGKEKFLAAYLGCGVVAGFTSMTYQLIKGRVQGAVGASGAILGLLGMIMYRHPEYRFHIVFLPMLSIPGPTVFMGLATMDLIGVIRGWQFFDHAGHLGGLFSGVAFEYLTHSKSKETSYLPWSTLPKDEF